MTGADEPNSITRSYWAVFLIVAAVVGAYYLWGVRAAGYEFEWRQPQHGYYNYLGSAFARGQLHLEIVPAPELLAQPDPWDPSVAESYKMHDMALYRGRYYLYHGALPALLLFAPWRLITGHDLPENFALFLLCFGGYLFSSGAFLQTLALAKVNPAPPLVALMLLALGLSPSIPYLLNRVWVYEIAIAGGYFCLSGALFCLAHALSSGRGALWLAGSGLLFGSAIACRPHLGLAAAIATAVLALYYARDRFLLAAFLAPLILTGLAVAAYNYARFGAPFEFGIRYLLSGPNQNRITLAARNLPPGLYFMLFQRPDFSPVFPWVKMASGYTAGVLPAGYFLEPTLGALFLAPFASGALLAPMVGLKDVRVLLRIATLSAISILLFVCGTGFTTQRYQVDYLPLLLFAALVSLSVYANHAAVRVAIAMLIACSVVVNLALAIAGPYGEMLKNQPGRYVRIARLLSPIARFRPILNPVLNLDLSAKFPDGARQSVVTLPQLSIYAERASDVLRIVSKSESSEVSADAPNPAGGLVAIRVQYSPQKGILTVILDGKQLLTQQIGTLVVALSQVIVGPGVRLNSAECR